jgi:hypothetical protein
MNINGLIGYTYMTKGDIKLILIADMHSIEYECSNVYISEWLKTKLEKKWRLLLEEVPRTPENISKLKELFPSAIHTKKLKNIYLEDSINIIGIDIRGELVKFSLELINEIKPNETLKEYLSLLNDFFTLQHNTFLKELKKCYNKVILNEIIIREHFEMIYSSYHKFLSSYKDFLEENISIVHQKNPSFIEELNMICSNIMEWYTIMKIFEEWSVGHKKFIIHCGLFHSSNIKDILLNLYSFDMIDEQGLNDFEQIEFKKHTGCLVIPNKITKL